MIRIFIPARILTLLASEMILLSACFLAAAYTDPDLSDVGVFLLYDSGILRVATVVSLLVLSLFLRNLYSGVRISSKLELFQELCMIFGMTFIMQAVLGYLNTNLIVPRKMMLAATVLALPALFGWRLLFNSAARNALPLRKVLFVGLSPTVAKIAQRLSAHPEFGLTTVGYLESGTPAPGPSTVRRLGTMADLTAVLDRTVPDSIVIAQREDIRPEWTDEFLALRFGGVHVEEAAALCERIFSRKSVTDMWPSGEIFADVSQRASLSAIRAFSSWVTALATAIVTLPFTLTVAALIAITSRGPILVRELRVGLHDKTFEAYRFRCVRQNGDPTPIGAFLRRYGLVWLPQLLNVLMGQMAMVGPRPERPLFAQRMGELIPVYRQRHTVKPGVTGWARVHRRRGEEQDSLKDLEYDLYYLKNFSLLSDFFILLLSLKAAARSADSGF